MNAHSTSTIIPGSDVHLFDIATPGYQTVRVFVGYADEESYIVDETGETDEFKTTDSLINELRACYHLTDEQLASVNLLVQD